MQFLCISKEKRKGQNSVLCPLYQKILFTGAYGWVPIVADASIEFNMGVIFLLPFYEIWNFSSSACV